ncbi:protein of unknown function [Bradyrhizobium vignae]|uniref:Uncharacterized protein n=1 Tax=Bradyrhizobium vignae TaxID=1549949 RepID=A0A2U3PWT4_9BRAD|nr:protein of unknown function [Bradyrhizobium vignae]
MRTLWMLLFSRAPVVFITRVGIRNTAIADDTMAWRSVRDLSARQFRVQGAAEAVAACVARSARTRAQSGAGSAVPCTALVERKAAKVQSRWALRP